ncbi:uncharacterized protein J3R85_009670 [Psidium guajava]|nr:uncharacterized protein J3R85_009670 [Psidium guajava]
MVESLFESSWTITPKGLFYVEWQLPRFSSWVIFFCLSLGWFIDGGQRGLRRLSWRSQDASSSSSSSTNTTKTESLSPRPAAPDPTASFSSASIYLCWFLLSHRYLDGFARRQTQLRQELSCADPRHRRLPPYHPLCLIHHYGRRVLRARRFLLPLFPAGRSRPRCLRRDRRRRQNHPLLPRPTHLPPLPRLTHPPPPSRPRPKPTSPSSMPFPLCSSTTIRPSWPKGSSSKSKATTGGSSSKQHLEGYRPIGPVIFPIHPYRDGFICRCKCLSCAQQH